MHRDDALGKALENTGAWLLTSAGKGYLAVVRRTYRTLTGQKSDGEPLQLVERLARTERLTPEAAYFLLAVGRALADVGAFGKPAKGLAALLRR